MLTRLSPAQNAVEVLERAIPFAVDEVIDKCINTIARNFSNYKADLDWAFLSFPVFLKVCLFDIYNLDRL